LVLDVVEERVEPLVAALAGLGLQARPSPWRRNTMACTGLEFCKLAIVDTKQRASWLVDELERRVPELDVPITVNVNGCPNSCARTQVADIGLKGMIVLSAGQQVEGFQVHLGGALGLEAGFGRKLRAHKVPAEQLADYVERVVRSFLRERSAGQSFAAWAQVAGDEALR
jgi:sulfite reductase (ferredoxin)